MTQSTPVAASPIDRVLRSRIGPTLLAVGLGLLSSPIVATAIAATSVGPDWPGLVERAPIDFTQALPIAVLADVLAALAAGAIGARFLRREPLWSLLLGVAIAWPVAIASLPIVPTLLRMPFATGYFCFDACDPQIHSGEILSGLTAYLASLLGLLASGLLTALLVVAAWLARRRGRRLVAAALGIAAVTSINLFSLVGPPGGAFLAYMCLVIGAVIWVTPYWREWDRSRAGTAVGEVAAENGPGSAQSTHA